MASPGPCSPLHLALWPGCMACTGNIPSLTALPKHGVLIAGVLLARRQPKNELDEQQRSHLARIEGVHQDNLCQYCVSVMIPTKVAHLMTNFLVPSSFSPPMGALVRRQDATCSPDSCLGFSNANLQVPNSFSQLIKEMTGINFSLHLQISIKDARRIPGAAAGMLSQRGVYLKPSVLWVTGHFFMTLKERHSSGFRAAFDLASSACEGTACRASQAYISSLPDSVPKSLKLWLHARSLLMQP